MIDKTKMILGLQKLESTIGMDLELQLTIILIVPAIIFFAKDLKLGSIMLIIFNALLTMFFIAAEWNYRYSLSLMFVGVIILCLSLYFDAQQSHGVSII